MYQRLSSTIIITNLPSKCQVFSNFTWQQYFRSILYPKGNSCFDIAHAQKRLYIGKSLKINANSFSCYSSQIFFVSVVAMIALDSCKSTGANWYLKIILLITTIPAQIIGLRRIFNFTYGLPTATHQFVLGSVDWHKKIYSMISHHRQVLFRHCRKAKNK